MRTYSGVHRLTLCITHANAIEQLCNKCSSVSFLTFLHALSEREVRLVACRESRCSDASEMAEEERSRETSEGQCWRGEQEGEGMGRMERWHLAESDSAMQTMPRWQGVDRQDMDGWV